jgi:SecD/SecF fusion protein
VIFTSSLALSEATDFKSFSVRVVWPEDETGNKVPVAPHAVAQSITITEDRLNALGLADVQITKKGVDGFVVRVKGLKPDRASEIANIIQKPGKLELKEVSQRNEELGKDGKTLAQLVKEGIELVPGYRAYDHKVKDEEGNETTRTILAKRRSAIRNGDVASAIKSPVQEGAVSITLNADGADKMIALTKNMRPGMDRIAILIDGEVISAPTLLDVPLGKNFEINGLHSPGEVESIAISFMNPLEFQLVVEEERAAPSVEKSK